MTAFTFTECDEGFYGDNCNKSCTCVQENTKSCNKTSGDCKCQSGFRGVNCEEDILECTELSPCPERSQCVEETGGYSCLCDVGYLKSETGDCIGRLIS